MMLEREGTVKYKLFPDENLNSYQMMIKYTKESISLSMDYSDSAMR